MPEVTDNSSLVKISENPYSVALETLQKMSPEQIRNAALRGLASLEAELKRTGRENSIPRARELFKVTYNVFLPDSVTQDYRYDRFSGLSEEEKRELILGVQIAHKFVHYALAGKSEMLDPKQVGAISKIASVSEALNTRPIKGSEMAAASAAWRSIKTELAVVETFVKEGWGVLLSDHQQPYDPKREWSHEAYQMDIASKIDFVAKVPTKIGLVGLLVDTKAKHWLGEGIETHVGHLEERNPLVRRILLSHNIRDAFHLEIGVGTNAFVPYKPGDSLKNFSELKPEVRSAIIIDAGTAIRDYLGE